MATMNVLLSSNDNRAMSVMKSRRAKPVFRTGEDIRLMCMRVFVLLAR